MKKRTLIVAAIVATLALSAPFVVAAERGHHRGGHGDFAGPMMMFEGRGFERIKTALNLSDAQVSQLQTIREELRAQNAPYRESLRGGFGKVAQALLANPNDLAGAQALLDQQEDSQRTMKRNTLAAASRALNVLTPEQRAKVSQFLADRAARHRDAQ